MNDKPTLDMVCEMARNLPCAPWLMPKLIEALDKEDGTVQDLEDVISKDPGMTSSILRLANSVVFASTRKCDSVGDALLRLGRREVYRIAASSIAGRWLVQEIDGYGWEPGDLCKHSLCVAVAADLVAQKTELVKAEAAYTAGLLHDVGKLALAYGCSEFFEQIRAYQEENECTWHLAEQALLGYDHLMIGENLLKGWSFPDEFVDVARYYPEPEKIEGSGRGLGVVIHAAKHLSLVLGYGVGEDGFRTELNEDLLEEHGLSSDVLEELIPSLFEKSEALIEAAGDKSMY